MWIELKKSKLNVEFGIGVLILSSDVKLVITSLCLQPDPQGEDFRREVNNWHAQLTNPLFLNPYLYYPSIVTCGLHQMNIRLCTTCTCMYHLPCSLWRYHSHTTSFSSPRTVVSATSWPSSLVRTSALLTLFVYLARNIHSQHRYSHAVNLFSYSPWLWPNCMFHSHTSGSSEPPHWAVYN